MINNPCHSKKIRIISKILVFLDIYANTLYYQAAHFSRRHMKLYKIWENHSSCKNTHKENENPPAFLKCTEIWTISYITRINKSKTIQGTIMTADISLAGLRGRLQTAELVWRFWDLGHQKLVGSFSFLPYFFQINGFLKPAHEVVTKAVEE